MNLDKYKFPLEAMPFAAGLILNQESLSSEFSSYKLANEIHKDNSLFAGSITKDSEGSYLVQCLTEMPQTTPKMVDWWFGWHMPESERYKLWHPRDHISSKLIVDTSMFKSDKEKYIGVDSYVTEYIGKELNDLCISFKDPALFGFDELDPEKETAICAEVVSMSRKMKIASLTHYVKVHGKDSVMQSSFWLGMDLEHKNRILNLMLKPILRVKAIKSFLLNDRVAKDLYTHCSEEMNHLSKFLPSLYLDMHES